MNLPKFVFDDVPLFLGLITDLFPGLECHRVTYPELGKAIDDELRKKSYVPLENQVNIYKLKNIYQRLSKIIVPLCHIFFFCKFIIF